MRWREVAWRIKKPARTAQSYFPFLKETKDAFYRRSRRLLRVPSERCFSAIKLFADVFEGSYVDVGGNTGQSIEAIRLYAPRSRIISFEPNPGLARQLSHRYRNDPLIIIKDVGLADTQGRMGLYVPSYRGFVYDGLGSLSLEEASGWLGPDTLYFFDPEKLKVQAYECAIETLDMQNVIDAVFIKVDVEGTEYGVLKGGLETLRRCRPVLLIEDIQEKPMIQGLLEPLGYSPYQFERNRFSPGYLGGSTFLFTPDRIDAIREATVG